MIFRFHVFNTVPKNYFRVQSRLPEKIRREHTVWPSIPDTMSALMATLSLSWFCMSWWAFLRSVRLSWSSCSCERATFSSSFITHTVQGDYLRCLLDQNETFTDPDNTHFTFRAPEFVHFLLLCALLQPQLLLQLFHLSGKTHRSPYVLWGWGGGTK